MIEPILVLHRIRLFRRNAWIISCTAALLVLLVAWHEPHQWLRAYLFAFIGCVELSFGCLALLMIFHLVGGEWGKDASAMLESGAFILPWMAIAFLPIAFALPDLYPWANPDQVAASALLRHKAPYLNVPFFLARAAACFAIWSALVYFLRKGSIQAMDAKAHGEKRLETRARSRLAALSGLGLVLYGISMHIAAFDWTMSLEPEWYSTMYGFLMISSQAPPVLALALFSHLWLGRGAALTAVVSPTRLADLGNLLLAFLLIWVYISFMQFLIIWSGNLPEETSWYLHRLRGGWQWLALALVVFQFALPFFLLMFRRVKEKPRRLLPIAAGLLLVHWVHMFWLIAPAFSPGILRVHILDIAAPLAMGGAWVALFAGGLARPRSLPGFSQGPSDV